MPVPAYDIPTFVTINTPPNYRLPKFLTFVQSLCSGLTWRKEIFDSYRNGDDQSKWNTLVTYDVDAKVFWNFATYQSLTSGNIGLQPDLNPDKWILRNSSNIGASERVMINGGVLSLTFELNRIFGTTFRQPPWPAPYDFGLGGGTFSDIYITNSVTQFSTIVSRTVGFNKSVSRTKGAGLVSRTIGFTGSITSYLYVINVPIAIYNALGSTDAIRTAVMTRFVNIYNPCGLSFKIQPY